MNVKGQIIKGLYDKFRQINRFLELVADTYPSLPAEGALVIIDCGCGRSYLTFALHWLFSEHFRREVIICGIDKDEQIIAECTAVAARLAIDNLQFVVSDIADFAMNDVDMVVSLHACDTATDAVLARAVHWKAQVILASPCCQHQLAPQLKAEGQSLILKHGIMRERMGAIVTDALRAAALEALGWSCQVIEFIDMEHTAKNLLLRAERRRQELHGAGNRRGEAYRELKSAWGVSHFALEEYLTESERKMLGTN